MITYRTQYSSFGEVSEGDRYLFKTVFEMFKLRKSYFYSHTQNYTCLFAEQCIADKRIFSAPVPKLRTSLFFFVFFCIAPDSAKQRV